MLTDIQELALETLEDGDGSKEPGKDKRLLAINCLTTLVVHSFVRERVMEDGAKKQCIFLSSGRIVNGFETSKYGQKRT